MDHVKRGTASGRGFVRAPVTQRVVGLALAIILPAVLSLNTSGVPSKGQPGKTAVEAASPGVSVPVTPVKPVAIPLDNKATTPFRATDTSWPAATSATVALAVPAGGAKAAQAHVQAGSSPAWVQPVANSQGAYTGPSTAKVQVLSHSAATALGVSGVVVAVSGTSSSTGQVNVGLNYKSFSQEYGGNYGSQLTLVSLPACALTTPQVKACQVQTPLPSAANNQVAQSVSAQVALGGQTAYRTDSVDSTALAAPAATTALHVIAAVAGSGTEGGTAGSYAATSLKPSGSWNEGGDSGSFDYTYPITLPAASSTLTPPVTLSYDSQEVDGQTSVTQAQSGWAGDGWSTPDSFIEQSFITCADSPEGVSLPTAEATQDECYDGPILTVSLNGETTSLVCNAAETQCTEQSDNGSVISHVTSSSNGSNTYNTDYWVITERDGNQYFFGLNKLPGYASGDATTNSVDYEPVYSANSGDPCYSSSGFSSSVCNMAYRWHLDYVTNLTTTSGGTPTGQAMSYYYAQTTNYYGEDANAKAVKYISDSYLSEIDYGYNAGGAYGTVPDKVVFAPNANGRCVQSSCTSLTSSSMTSTIAGQQYPDVPSYLYCPNSTTGGLCTSFPPSPSFFSLNRLASITTEQYSTSASAYENVDTYTLTQTEPQTGDTTNSTLWLQGIQHTGDDTSAGGSSAAIPMPSETFGGIDLANRVDTANFPALDRYRLNSITSEMGSVTSVTYGNPDQCTDSYVTAQTATSAASNTDSCYPVYWMPPGDTTQVMDWFESYAVTQVLVSDHTGGALQEETDYSYGTGAEGAAWHYDDNEVTKPEYRTYGQFRGYGTVTTNSGQTAYGPQTDSVNTYYRGMDGDWLSSTSTRSVTLTDSMSGQHTDSDALAGDVLESQTYNGVGGALESDSITSYWVSGAVQTRTRTGLPSLNSQMAEIAETWSSQADSDGGESGVSTVTETDNAFDTGTTDPNFGLTEFSYKHTVPVNTAYDSCETTQYAPANTTENIVGLVSYAETDSVACSGFVEATPATAPSSTSALAAPSAAAVNAPQHVVSAVETFYDDPTFNTTFPQTAEPTLGMVSMSLKECGYAAPACPSPWIVTSENTYDSYGRSIDGYSATAAAQNAASPGSAAPVQTTYAVNSVGLTTGETVTSPATTYQGSSGTVTVQHVTSDTIDPTRALVMSTTDDNGVVTNEHYDALGRLTGVWEDSTPTSSPANIVYTYTVSNSTVSGVVAQNLNNEGVYVSTVTIDDSLGRTRQVQTQTPQGGRLIEDTIYDSHGWVMKKNTNYWDKTTSPTLALVAVADNLSADQDDYVYNGLGQQVEDFSEDNAVVKTTSVTVYNGDSGTVISGIPGTAASGVVPAGGSAIKTMQADPLGRDSTLIEYTANPTLTIPSNPTTGTWYLSGGSTNATSYGYDSHGNRATVTDQSGDSWTQTYNLLGKETQTSDPDAGAATTEFDADGNVIQTEDSSGKYTSYTYDALNRKTAQFTAAANNQVLYTSPTSPGNETASWVYDNANGAITTTSDSIGQVTTETTYSGGYPYVEQSLGFDVFGKSEGTNVEIPSIQGTTLGKNWKVQDFYTPTIGLPEQITYPSGGGLPSENVSFSYGSALDLNSSVGSSLSTGGYAGSTTYTDLSHLVETQIGSPTSYANLTDQYDPHTGLLTNQTVSTATGTNTPAPVDSLTYTYNTAGLTTAETDERNGSTSQSETQCFTYTSQAQLSVAWTATDNCAAVPTSASHATVGDSLGTSSAYWETWNYNANGTQNQETDYNASAGTTSTTTDTYNGNSGTDSQPTTLTSTSGNLAGPTSYTYDANGEQIARTTTGLGSQTLSWNNLGELTSVSTGSTTTGSYVYDPEGNLLLQTDGTSTTLYLPGEQITYNSSTGTTASDRYYSLPGGATAVRTGTGNNYGFEFTSDQHGTNTLYLNYTAQTPTWRQDDPYGNARGPGATWVDNRGFLNKVDDTATGLTDVGARWFDPVTGSFVSLDVVFEAQDPTQLGGYDYSGNDPVSTTDPTGNTRTTIPTNSEPPDCQPGFIGPVPPGACGGGGGGGGGGGTNNGGGGVTVVPTGVQLPNGDYAYPDLSDTSIDGVSYNDIFIYITGNTTKATPSWRIQNPLEPENSYEYKIVDGQLVINSGLSFFSTLQSAMASGRNASGIYKMSLAQMLDMGFTVTSDGGVGKNAIGHLSLTPASNLTPVGVQEQIDAIREMLTVKNGAQAMINGQPARASSNNVLSPEDTEDAITFGSIAQLASEIYSGDMEKLQLLVQYMDSQQQQANEDEQEEENQIQEEDNSALNFRENDPDNEGE